MSRRCTPNYLVGQRIGNGRIELVGLLGEGSYGCVYRGVLHNGDGGGSPPKPLAVKCIDKTGLDAYHLMMQRREVQLHQQVSDGAGVVTLYEAFEEHGYQFLVMEFCGGGDLWDAIATGAYAERDDLVRDLFVQILEAVEYCHARRVFHRDLKPENVLLADGGRKVLLADFGLASGSPLSHEMRCGSPWYMSPECWGIDTPPRAYATAPNDVWALGIVLINLACGGHAPWKQATPRDAAFRDFLAHPSLLRTLLPLARGAHDVLARIFVVPPAARITLRDLRLLVLQTRDFVLPAAQRRAWILRRAPLRLVPSMDITDAARALQSSVAFDIPIADTRPALASASSVDSAGPPTPETHPMPGDDADVPDIAIADADAEALPPQGQGQGQGQGDGMDKRAGPLRNILGAVPPVVSLA